MGKEGFSFSDKGQAFILFHTIYGFGVYEMKVRTVRQVKFLLN